MLSAAKYQGLQGRGGKMTSRQRTQANVNLFTGVRGAYNNDAFG
jgi:hypothetical protein